MKHFSKHLKSISYFLSSIILFQSCIIYKKTSVDELSKCSDKRIVVNTVNGDKHIFTWIEEVDKTVISTKNVDRHCVDKSEIMYILKPDEPVKVPLDSALKYNMAVRVKTNNEFGRDQTYSFFKIENRDNIVTGYEMTKGDTSTIVLPISQIKTIKNVNNGATVGINTAGAIGLALFVAWISVMSQLGGEN